MYFMKSLMVVETLKLFKKNNYVLILNKIIYKNLSVRTKIARHHGVYVLQILL